MRYSSRRWVVPALLALGVGAASVALAPGARGQGGPAPALLPESLRGAPWPGGGGGRPPAEPLRRTPNATDDSQPLLLDADHITPWLEDGYTALLLHGQVLAQRGVLQARFRQGVCWIAPPAGNGGLLRLTLYAE